MIRRRKALRRSLKPLKRTELKRATQPIKRTPIRYKPPSNHAERAAVVKVVRERDRSCRAPSRGAPGACRGRLDVHEILPRGRGGDWLDVNNCILICRAHHDWVHGPHSREAEALGLLKRSGTCR